MKGNEIRKKENRLLVWMILFSLCGMVLYLFLILWSTGIDESRWELCLGPMSIISTLSDVMYLMVTLTWYILMDYELYQSDDHLKRARNRHIFPLLIALAALAVFEIVFLLMDKPVRILAVSFTCFILENAYVVRAWIKMRRLEKIQHIPSMLRLSVFIVPMAIGFVASLFTHAFVMCIGSLAGVILTAVMVYRRHKYIDADTGFYSESFLPVLGTYNEKTNTSYGYKLSLEAPENKESLAELIHRLRPDYAPVFFMGAGKFQMLLSTDRENEVRYLMSVFNRAAEKEGLSLKMESQAL